MEVKDVHGNVVEFSGGQRGAAVALITLKGKGSTKSMILEYIASNNGNPSSSNSNASSSPGSSKELSALTAVEWAVLLKYLVYKSVN